MFLVFREIIAVYCENQDIKSTFFWQNAQVLDVFGVQGNNCRLLWESGHKKIRFVGRMHKFWMCNSDGMYS
jgi:hypothetical protein